MSMEWKQYSLASLISVDGLVSVDFRAREQPFRQQKAPDGLEIALRVDVMVEGGAVLDPL